MKKFISIAAVALAMMFAVSCSSDDDNNNEKEPVMVDYRIDLVFPENLTDAKFSRVDVAMKNTATGKETEKSFNADEIVPVETRATAAGYVVMTVEEGRYDITIEATITFTNDEGEEETVSGHYVLTGAPVDENNDSSGELQLQTGEIGFRLTLNLPASLNEPSLKHLDVTILDLNTATEETVSFEGMTPSDNDSSQGYVTLKLQEGRYDLSLSAKVSYLLGQVEKNCMVSAERKDVRVDQSTQGVNIQLVYLDLSKGFVIEEIFFTGTVNNAGSQYNGGDKYFLIYNNSDELLYADGIAILESEFMTVSKYEYKPDLMSTDFAVGAVYVVPGSGTDVAVEPGSYLVISDNAIDHTQFNSESFNLDETVSDFEWYDESPDPDNADLDNPKVPNLDKWYCYTRTIWSTHNRGFKSYAIAKMEVDKETFLTDYRYHYDYDMVIGGDVYPMDGDCYRVPNAWILDAVNLSVASEREWGVFDPSLDTGWTYCGNGISDKTRYGKAVRRKVEREEGGRRYLVDTNNSTDDFFPEVVPTLMN